MVTIPCEVMETIQNFLDLLKPEIHIEKVILFGSYAKGTHNESSDIDLAIISPDFKQDKCIEDMTFLLCTANKLKADIQTIPFSLAEYEEPVGLLEEILRTGVELEAA